jgi:4-hydroxybenzoate polyprenyltransferase
MATGRGREGDRPSLLLALALSTHPGPALAVTIVGVALGVGAGLDPLRLTIVGLALLFDQASVGLSNDWIDAERDRAVGRLDKPIARGWIAVSAVRVAAWAAAAIALALTIPLGWWALTAHTIALCSAWSYNVWLKKTPISVLPYIVSFGLLPAIVTLARPEPVLAAPWALAAGASLGIAAHFANVLPDFAHDSATGVRGLPHILGRTISAIVIGLTLSAGSVCVAIGTWSGVVSAVVLACTVSLAIGATVLAIARPPRRLLFQLIIGASLINVAMLVLAGARLYS